MFGESWERYAPLTGVVFFVIVLIGFLIGGDTPGSDDSAQEVLNFYSPNRDEQSIVAIVVAIGAAFLPFFVSHLRRTLDWAGGTGRLVNAGFGGGILATSGFWILATVHLALADSAGKTAPEVTQALNVLDNNDWIPVAAGMGVMLIGYGLAAVRYGGLPSWLAWAGFVIGILVFTPAGFFAFLAGGLWILVTSIVLFMAGPFVETPTAEPLPG
jgi:hypothetical protein